VSFVWDDGTRLGGLSTHVLMSFVMDFKLGFRMLVKYPGLTLVGGLAIAVAVGIGAAFFEIAHDQVNATLPLDEGERVIAIQNWMSQRRRQNIDHFMTRGLA